MNFKVEKLTPLNNQPESVLEEINEFLFKHLDRFGDPKADIRKAMDYALSTEQGKGGVIVFIRDEQKNNQVIGAVVVNETGMKDYIPENILVYIAVHEGYRGAGLGKMLMQEVMQAANGSIALHVEPDNPAKKLYEKLGFTNKYLEMRWKKV